MLRIITLVMCLLTWPAWAATKGLSFDIELYADDATAAPGRLTGLIWWTFNHLDPVNTAAVSAIDLTLDGKTFALGDVGLFTDADTDLDPDQIVIGGTYDGSFPNQIGGYGPATDFALSILNAFSSPSLEGATAYFLSTSRVYYSSSNPPSEEPTYPAPVPLPSAITMLIAALGLLWFRRALPIGR